MLNPDDPRKRRINWGLFEALDQGLTAGIYDLGSNAGDLMSWAGFPEYGDPISKFSHAEAAKHAPDPSIAGHVTDNPALLSDPTWWAYNTARMVPTQAPTYAVGGGLFAGARALGAGASMAAGAAAAGTGLVGGLMEGSQTYRQGLEMGMSEHDASMAAAGMAAGSAALNALSGAVTFGTGNSVLKVLGKAAVEGGTEAAEEPVESVMLGYPMKEALKNAVDVFFPAALSGGAGAITFSGQNQGADNRSAPTARKMVDILQRENAPDAEAVKELAKNNYAQIAEAAQGKGISKSTIDQALADSIRPVFQSALRDASPFSPTVSARDVAALDTHPADSLYAALDKAMTANPKAAYAHEEAAQGILAVTGNDPHQAERIARVSALLAANDSVNANPADIVAKSAAIVRGNQKALAGTPAPMVAMIQNAIAVPTVTRQTPGFGPKTFQAYQAIADAVGTVDAKTATPIDRYTLLAAGLPRNKNVVSDSGAREMGAALQEATAQFNKANGTNLLPRQAQAAISASVRSAEQAQTQRGIAQDMPSVMKMADMIQEQQPEQAKAFVQAATAKYQAVVAQAQGKPVAPEVIDKFVMKAMQPAFKQAMAARPTQAEKAPTGPAASDIAKMPFDKFYTDIARPMAEKATPGRPESVYVAQAKNAYQNIVKRVNVEQSVKVMDAQSPAANLNTTPQSMRPSLADSQIQAEAARLTKGWKLAPQTIVAPSMQYAPDYVKAEAVKRGGNANGFYDNRTGAVWLIADQLHSVEDVQKTVLHEMWGHHGLRLLGEDADPILRDVSAKYDLNKIAGEYNLDLGNNEHRLIAAEEQLARLIETHKDAGLVQRAIAYVRQGLRKMGFTMTISDNDIRYGMTQLSRAVRTGQGAKQVVAGQGVNFSQNEGENNAKQDQAPSSIHDNVQQPGGPQGGNEKMSTGKGGAGVPPGGQAQTQGLSDAEKYARPSSINIDKAIGGIEDANTAANVETLTRVLAKQFAGTFEETKRSVITHEMTNKLAADIGADPKFMQEFLTRKLGTAYNAEYLSAAQSLHRDSEEHTAKMVDEYKKALDAGTLTDTQRAEMSLQLQRHVLVESQYSGVAAEAGRALGILSQYARLPRERIRWKEIDINSIVSDGGGRDNLDMLITGIAAAKETGQLNQAVRAAVKTKFIDKVLEAWISGLMTGPQTHVVNAVSNSLVSVLGDVESFLAAGIGRLHGGERYTLSEALGRVRATVPGILHGFSKFGEAMKSEEAVDLFGRLDGFQHKAIEGKLGSVVRLPLRFLNASDMFSKSVAISKYLYAESFKTGHSFESLAADPAVMEKAWDAARYETFTNPLGDLGQRVTAMAVAHPWMRFIIPFIRTPTNIVKFAAERSPLAPAMGRFQQAFKEGGAARDMAVARMALGSATMLSVYVLASAGGISGAGPDDPRKKAMLRATGWAPYSIKIGDKWYSYQRLEPVGMLIGLAADMHELGERVGEGDMSKVIQLGTMSFFHNITSKTYLRGLSDVMNAITDPERYGERWFASLAGTAIPTGVAQLARTNDPYLREAKGIMDQLRARNPFAREGLPVKRDVFGQPIKAEGGVGPDILSPVYTSSVTGDKVADELVRLGVSPGAPGNSIANHKLSAAEHDSYAQYFGKLMRDLVQQKMYTPGWKYLPDPVKVEMIDQAVTDARKYARQMVLAKYPQIMQRIGERA